MPEGVKGPEFMSKLDRLQDEYAAIRKQIAEPKGDLYLGGKCGDDKEISLNCRFKGNCYTLRSGNGTCPCGLNE
jgi:hypothetical protein